MLTFTRKNIFTLDVNTIICTVNCVGIMGKGIALEVNNRWPQACKQYFAACARKDLTPGGVIYVPSITLPNLLFVATKDHWVNASKIIWVRYATRNIVAAILTHQIPSIAIPPLGCGNGRLDWLLVKPILQKGLANIPCEIFITEPPQTSKPRVLLQRKKVHEKEKANA